MITKLGILVLGILSDGRSSFSEISLLLEELKVQRWFPVNNSTLEIACNNLLREDLIKTAVVKETEVF